MPDVAAWLTGIGVAVIAGVQLFTFLLGRVHRP
jgi:hypothetical protein